MKISPRTVQRLLASAQKINASIGHKESLCQTYKRTTVKNSHLQADLLTTRREIFTTSYKIKFMQEPSPLIPANFTAMPCRLAVAWVEHPHRLHSPTEPSKNKKPHWLRKNGTTLSARGLCQKKRAYATRIDTCLLSNNQVSLTPF